MRILVLLLCAACDAQRRPLSEVEHDAQRVDAGAVHAEPDAMADAAPPDPCRVDPHLDEESRRACFQAIPGPHRARPSRWVCDTGFVAGELVWDLPSEWLDDVGRYGWSLHAREAFTGWLLRHVHMWQNVTSRLGQLGDQAFVFPCYDQDLPFVDQYLLSSHIALHCGIERIHQAVQARGFDRPLLTPNEFFAVPEVSMIADSELRARADGLARIYADAFRLEPGSTLLDENPPACMFEALGGCGCEEGQAWNLGYIAIKAPIRCRCAQGEIHCDLCADATQCALDFFDCSPEGNPTCCGFPPLCTGDRRLTVRGGCWVCVDAQTCAPTP